MNVYEALRDAIKALEATGYAFDHPHLIELEACAVAGEQEATRDKNRVKTAKLAEKVFIVELVRMADESLDPDSHAALLDIMQRLTTTRNIDWQPSASGSECLCPMLDDGLCQKENASCYMVKKEKCTTERMCNNCFSGQGECLNK